MTLLYVPADRPDRCAKAIAGDADVVLLDLEDAVAATGKDQARSTAVSLAAEAAARGVQVRVNGPGTPWHRDDLQAVATLPAQVGVRLPKVTSPDDVGTVVEVVGTDRPLHLLLETALGVECAFELARCAPSVASVGLGEADLGSDLGVGSDGLDWARQRIVVASRAAGLPAPAQSVFPDVRDLDGLRDSTRRGRALGFVGRCAIHPAQLPVIREATRPDDAEVARARAVVERVGEAQQAGTGVVVLADGSFVDVAMVDHARMVLSLAQATAPG